ncbi:hypothetical protein J4405_03540 [Candidatus Woesearchaeota archaeon]|nr:hypothetical protein [Candidatus Woesearchaeota archaeon]
MKIQMFKKGELHWDMIARALMVLAFLIIILLIIMAFKTKQFTLIERIKNLITFGG